MVQTAEGHPEVVDMAGRYAKVVDTAGSQAKVVGERVDSAMVEAALAALEKEAIFVAVTLVETGWVAAVVD